MQSNYFPRFDNGKLTCYRITFPLNLFALINCFAGTGTLQYRYHVDSTTVPETTLSTTLLADIYQQTSSPASDIKITNEKVEQKW
jgi:hypothetical protein